MKEINFTFDLLVRSKLRKESFAEESIIEIVSELG